MNMIEKIRELAVLFAVFIGALFLTVAILGDIASKGKGDCYRFLYACCVLQWVANKIVDKEAK